MNKFMIKKGFTIIELIVVIAILGVLVLLAGPRLLGYVEKAELRRIQHDVKVMEQEIGTVFISKDDDFNKWEDNSKDLNQLIEESRLFGKKDVAKDEPTDEPYKVIPEKYKDKINTKLKGTFYANSGGKVYYEHEKPLSGIPSEPEKEPVYSDEEINDLIDNNFIPVATAEELNNVRNATLETYGKGTKWVGEYTGGLDKKYVQVANIDLSEYSEEGWAPIGNNNFKFTGFFDGNGYSITGLTIDRPDINYVGLFGYTDGATIENVALEDINVTGKDSAGGLVGYTSSSTTISNSYATGSVAGTGSYTGGLVGYTSSSTTISNSYATGSVAGVYSTGGLVGYLYGSITNSYATGPVEGTGNSTGGLVGQADSSTVTNSYATGSVTSIGSNVGGLVGYSGNSTIENSHATGSVTGTRYVGGLVGYAIDSSTQSTKIDNSYATGPVTGKDYTGGLVGYTNSSTITNSHATGEVTGTGDHTGGLVGEATNYTKITNSYATGSVTGVSSTGGLVGYARSTTSITNSYATGSVTGTGDYTGGLMGQAWSSTITKSYWNTETTGQDESAGGGEGKTTEDMMKQTTYSGWDFEKIWQIDEGVSYPTLR